MVEALASPWSDETDQTLEVIFRSQGAAFRAEHGGPGLDIRLDRLHRVASLLQEGRQVLCDAVAADYLSRSTTDTLLHEIAVVLEELAFVREHVAQWMQPDNQQISWRQWFAGERVTITREPLGVVGVMSPWSAPILLTLMPLVGALAAGNRVMVKPSDLTPACADAIADLITRRFDSREVAVITGGPEIADDFARLPFDHLLFTGSTETGRHIAAIAGRNLTPVTLELGGKCPAIIGRSADLDTACRRIVAGKLVNAGQNCLAPDYLLVPDERIDAVVRRLESAAAALPMPNTVGDQIPGLINAAQRQRLERFLDDARENGGGIHVIGPDWMKTDAAAMPLTLILNPADAMRVMREEIFGPILPVRGYRDLGDAITYINDHPRPLALYFFGSDDTERNRVIFQTSSGGVTVDDVMRHHATTGLSFGGVGASGSGRYHGLAGFKVFSNEKSIFHRGRRFRSEAPTEAPQGPRAKAYLDSLLGKR